jgi:hypothetical protein
MQMTEIAENPAARDAAAARDDDVEEVLQRVREAVARSREMIQATHELLGSAPDPSPDPDEAAGR